MPPPVKTARKAPQIIFLAESGASSDMMMARLDETDKSVNADAFKSKGTHEY